MTERWEEIELEPHDFGCHAFDRIAEFRCSGGDRCNVWSIWIRNEAAFVGYKNHDWVVRFSSHPSATKWESRGGWPSCIDRPEARLITLREVPEAARGAAVRMALGAIRRAREKMDALRAAEDADVKRKREIREAYEKSIVDDWAKLVHHKESPHD